VSAVEETLAWEAEQRPRAAAAAFIGGVCTIAGSLLYLLALRDAPTEDDGFISLTEALNARLNGQAPSERSLLAAQIAERQDHAPAIWLSVALSCIGVVLAMLALLYLYRATKARAPEATGRPARIAALVGLVVYPIGTLLFEGAALLDDEPHTAEQARDVLSSTPRLIGGLLQFVGTFGLGLAFVLVALNAMRVGLLTRFMGILGIIVGVLAVVQGLDLPQAIRTFWLITLAGLFAGRVVRRPPAWETGRAQPWPSQQQIREARQQAALGTNVPPSEPDSPAERGATEATAAAPKRKRKKRR
jgi:hypothetical protein